MAERLGACLKLASKLLRPSTFNPENGKKKISKIHISLMSVAAGYCIDKWPEIDMNNVTELTAVILILSRECGYSLLLFKNWPKIKEMLRNVLNDRKVLENDADKRVMALNYSRVEVYALVFYFVALIASIVLSTAAAAFVCPNEHCLPINCNFFFLPIRSVHGLNWFINYLYQGTVYSFEATFFTAYLAMSLVLMNQSCCLVDAVLISLQKFEESFVGESKSSNQRLPIAETASRFNDIVKSTWEIIEFQKSVQSLMKYSFLSEISLLSTVLCMTIFTLSTNVAGSSVAFLITLSNFSQFFLYCWMGSEFTARIEKLSNTLFGLSWDEMTPRQRKDLQLVILMTQNIRGFSGIFMKVDFGALTKILNLSYSFLAVLRTTSSNVEEITSKIY